MKKVISIFILLCFLATGQMGPYLVYAQDFRLPAPGVMVHLSPEFNPPILKGIKVHPDNPFRFDFILDQGDKTTSTPEVEVVNRLIKYFLASLTIPEKDLWVNLSPYEKDRIIPQSFGLTEMGRDLLAEDYMLKQITASLIYPEDKIGKKFWKRIYEESAKKFGTTNIPVNTFNKVWIVPDKAIVYENAKAGTAYVVESKLKVMLEQDYLALSHSVIATTNSDVNALGSQIIRQIVIPELTKEVNEDKNFSQLRQVYNSLILATWYKKKIKDSILTQVYENKNKVAGVNIDDPQEKERIYQRYLQAFKKGVFNYIREEQNPATQETTPIKYFSGGFNMSMDKAMAIYPMVKNLFFRILGKNNSQLKSVEVRLDDIASPDLGLKNTALISPRAQLTLLKNLTSEEASDDQNWEEIYKVFMESLNKEAEASNNPIFMVGGHPAAGKSHLINKLQEYLRQHGRSSFVISSSTLLSRVKFTRILRHLPYILFSNPSDRLKHIDSFLSNIDPVKELTRALETAGEHKDQELELTLPKRGQVKISKGTIIILDGSPIRNMFPSLKAVGVYFNVDPYQQRIRLKKRNENFALWRGYFDVKYKGWKQHLDVFDGQSWNYDYFIDVSREGNYRIYKQDGASGNKAQLTKPKSSQEDRAIKSTMQWKPPYTKAVIAMVVVSLAAFSAMYEQEMFSWQKLIRLSYSGYSLSPTSEMSEERVLDENTHIVTVIYKIQVDLGEIYDEEERDIWKHLLSDNPKAQKKLDESKASNFPKPIIQYDRQGYMQFLREKDKSVDRKEGVKFDGKAGKFVVIKEYQEDTPQIEPNPAMTIQRSNASALNQILTNKTGPGGIDFTAGKNLLEIQNSGQAIKFYLDPAMLVRLQNAPGFVPVIINIQPMTDLRRFLGLNVKEDSPVF